MWFTSKKKLKKQIETLQNELDAVTKVKDTVVEFNNDLADKVEEFMSMYPLTIGQTVYDLQLRSAKGRFTKTKPSREHSIINEVVVDKKNYFNLVDRYNSHDVFKTLEAAQEYLNTVCVD